MPRSKTVARNRTFPAENPEWPRARKAQLRRTVFQRMAKLRKSREPRAPDEEHRIWAGRPAAGPSSREEPCDADANSPSMPR